MMVKQKQKFFKVACCIGLSALAACSSGKPRSSTSSTTKSLELILPTEAVVEGRVFFVSVESPEVLKSVTGKFKSRDVLFYPESEHRFTALVGTEFGTDLGNTDFAVSACAEKCEELKGTIVVAKGKFPSEALKVPPRSIAPNKKDQVRIAKDQAVLKKVYASSESKKYWTGAVSLPVDNDITSVYGSSRVYNGKLSSAHLGTDFRAPTGTPIRAPLEGRVALARDLFYTGWTVILDHGYNFFTIYGHMSKLKVKEGQIVGKTDVLGLSGMTGRASGPHLHWGVKLHSMKIDAMSIVDLLGRKK